MRKHWLQTLKPALARAAQEVYDDWEQDENGLDPELGTGGICHRIAEKLQGVLDEHDPETWTDILPDEEHEHAFLLAISGDEGFVIDIPADVYETGGGFVWKKRPGVTITAADVVIEPVGRRNSKDYEAIYR